jgi:hypothetical protein
LNFLPQGQRNQCFKEASFLETGEQRKWAKQVLPECTAQKLKDTSAVCETELTGMSADGMRAWMEGSLPGRCYRETKGSDDKECSEMRHDIDEHMEVAIRAEVSATGAPWPGPDADPQVCPPRTPYCGKNEGSNKAAGDLRAFIRVFFSKLIRMAGS